MYDPNAQCTRNVDESVQYQQPQQQDYRSQQPYYQNYGRNESIPLNWQQQPAPGLTTDQTEANSQQQDKWNYEVCLKVAKKCGFIRDSFNTKIQSLCIYLS